jgi:Flp pilus assembly protein TadG
VEFAFIGPVLVLLLLAGLDTGTYVLATQRVQEVANSVAEMLSQTDAAVSPITAKHSGDGVVQDSDLHYYFDSAMATFPDVLAVANNTGTFWWQLLNVQMASIKFTASPTGCTSSCTYTDGHLVDRRAHLRPHYNRGAR